MNPRNFFSISVDIAAPPDHVWKIMSDVEKWPEWTRSVRKIRRLDDGPFRVGSRVIISQPKFPPALWKATAIDGRRSFTWVSRGPGILVTANHSIEPAPAGSRVTLSILFEGLLSSWFARLTAKINNEYLAMEAAGLKRQCEEN